MDFSTKVCVFICQKRNVQGSQEHTNLGYIRLVYVFNPTPLVAYRGTSPIVAVGRVDTQLMEPHIDFTLYGICYLGWLSHDQLERHFHIFTILEHTFLR